MTQMLTVRVPAELVAWADARAAELGLDRAKYVRGLIEQDLADTGNRARKHKFASEDFIGSVPMGGGPHTNRRVRESVRKRLDRKREKDR